MASRIAAFVTVSLCIVQHGTASQTVPSNSVFIKRALPLKTHVSLDSSEESFFPQRYPMDTVKAPSSVRILDPSVLLPPESRRPSTESPIQNIPSYEEPTISPLKRQIMYEAGTPEQEDLFPLRIAEENSGSVKHYNYNSNDNTGSNCKQKCPEQTNIGAAVVAPECHDQCNYELVERRTFICRPKDTVVHLMKSKAKGCDSLAAAASSSNAGRIGVIENAKNSAPEEIVEIDRSPKICAHLNGSTSLKQPTRDSDLF
ncbi:hypothetical protein pipiens_004172 [Culex pipiens pipiens]|uniref:Uncharacterized protein n=1 Tax=Culex pipiens pipiens TaxID=38569 RepID=A0ABD1CM59_CULPP